MIVVFFRIRKGVSAHPVRPQQYATKEKQDITIYSYNTPIKILPLSLSVLSFLHYLTSIVACTMAPNFLAKQCPMAPGKTHEEIQQEAAGSYMCPNCHCQWPEPIELDSDHQETTPSRTSSQFFGPRRQEHDQQLDPRHQQLPSLPRQRDRTTNFKKNFQQKAQQAYTACRQQKERSPYENPAGLLIRLMTIISLGEYTYGFFIPSKTIKTGMYSSRK